MSGHEKWVIDVQLALGEMRPADRSHEAIEAVVQRAAAAEFWTYGSDGRKHADDCGRGPLGDGECAAGCQP